PLPSCVFRQWAAGGVDPVVGAAVEHRYAVVAGPSQHGGGGHGAFAVATHDRDRLVRYRVGVGGQVAEFDVQGAGQMPRGVLAVLPDVEERPGYPVGPDQSGGGDRAAGRAPGGDAAGQFPGDVGEVDGERGPEDVGRVLVGVADDDDRDGGVQEPAQPGGELGPQRDRDGAGQVSGGDVGHRADVEDDRNAGETPPHRRRVQAGEGG